MPVVEVSARMRTTQAVPGTMRPTSVGVPRPLARRVSRLGLRRRIEEIAEPVLFVVAPAGFGKTDVLADWAHTTEREVAWVGCRPADREPAEFWSSVLRSLTGRWPEMGSDARLLLARWSGDTAELLTALGQDLAQLGLDAAAIVIDDCHLAEPSQSALPTLAGLLPEGFRVVVGSQHNPVFSVSRLRVSGVYTDLRSSDLAFSQSETDELLELAGLDLEVGEREELQSLTQGWPAGLQLATLAMRSAQDPGEVIRALSATPREVSDYLANEVIDRMAPELVEFMTGISVLDEFDVALCRAVTRREDSARLLDRVIEQDAFIQAADEAGAWYRFHPMFSAFLQARMKSLEPEYYEQLHRRALDVSYARGDLSGSLHHATAVNDLDRAAELVTEALSRGLEVGDVSEGRAVARAWLARNGEQAAASDPQRLLEVLLVLTSYGYREAERWLSRVSRHATKQRLPATVAALLEGAWGDYFLNRGQVDRCLEHNRRAQDLVRRIEDPTDTFPRFAELPLQEAGAHLLADDLPAAAAALRAASPVPHPLVDDYRVPVLRLWVAFLEGDLATARQGLRSLEPAESQDAVPYGLGSIFTDLLRGGLHLEDGELAAASRALARAAHATEVNGRPVIHSLVSVWLARLATAQRRHDAAVAALAQARLVLAQPDARVRQRLDLESLRVAIAFKSRETISMAPSDGAELLLVARLLIDQHSLVRASELLDAGAPLTLRDRIQWHLLQALAEREPASAGAQAHLRAALELAEPHGYVTTVLEQGEGITQLLRSTSDEGVLRDYVDGLLLAAQTSAGGTHRVAPDALEALSSRERTVLRLLASRLTSHEIASTLFISPNTLKTHTKNIYRKLGATTRSEAVRLSSSGH